MVHRILLSASYCRTEWVLATDQLQLAHVYVTHGEWCQLLMCSFWRVFLYFWEGKAKKNMHLPSWWTDFCTFFLTPPGTELKPKLKNLHPSWSCCKVGQIWQKNENCIKPKTYSASMRTQMSWAMISHIVFDLQLIFSGGKKKRSTRGNSLKPSFDLCFDGKTQYKKKTKNIHFFSIYWACLICTYVLMQVMFYST